MILIAAAIWLGDGLNRYRASQAMRAGRIALLSSDLPQAIGHFRTAALHRPTDEDVIRQYQQTQADWSQLVGDRLYILDPVDAYLAVAELKSTLPLLVEPHASKFRNLVANIEAGVRSESAERIAVARKSVKEGNFSGARDLLKALESVRALVPELPELLKEIQAAETTEARRRAGEALDEKRFADAREALGAGYPEYQDLVRRINAAEETFTLLEAGEAVKQDNFALAEEKLARAAALGADITDARKNIRNQARLVLALRIARGIAANDRQMTVDAIEQGRLHTGWEAVPVESLLAPADLPSFLAALEKFGLGTESQGKFVDRLDIPLVLIAQARLPATEVTEFLRTGFVNWSRTMSQNQLPGFALLLDDVARQYGAVIEADWRKQAVARVIESTHVTLAVAAPAADPRAPAGLNAQATAAFRRALQAKLGSWPKLIDHEPARPATVVFTGRYDGFYAEDDPAVTRKTVRYQSGTRQVPNHEYSDLVNQHNLVVDHRNELSRAIAQNQAKVDRANSGEELNSWEKSEAARAAGTLSQQRYALQGLDQQIRELKAQGNARPKYVSAPVYADEEYRVIKHNYSCALHWEMTANLHGTVRTVAEWVAVTSFQTDSVEGNASRGVPVKAPQPVPEQKLGTSLVPKLVAEVDDVSSVLDDLPDLTHEAFEVFHQKSPPMARLEQLLALGYAWDAAGRPMTNFTPVIAQAQQLINLR